jgi:uncharacterized protein YjbJ (UPF0337 family)
MARRARRGAFRHSVAVALHLQSPRTVDARAAREEGPMNRDEIKGKAEKAKGYVKDKAGELLNDPELETEGEIERASGAVQEAIGRAKRKAKDGIEEIAERVEDDIEE